MASYIPGLAGYLVAGTGGTNAARYCYSVWLRHLVMAHRNGLNTMPQVVAEIGPGDSLGIGLAALISGSQQYFAFDVVAHATTSRNLAIFDELVQLFKSRSPIPGGDEYPNVKPDLDNYAFPDKVLSDTRMADALATDRIGAIKQALASPAPTDVIGYKVPWSDTNVVARQTVDMIFSQAVLEHVDDLEHTYTAMSNWLKPNGYISHQIDYGSHGTAQEWNGHWTYSNVLWRLYRGRKTFLINRQPHSAHIGILDKQGYQIVCNDVLKTTSKYAASELAKQFRQISADDLTTRGAFVQAIWPGNE